MENVDVLYLSQVQCMNSKMTIENKQNCSGHKTNVIRHHICKGKTGLSEI